MIETVIQRAIDEWASIAGGPAAQGEPRVTLAHYIARTLDADVDYGTNAIGCFCGDQSVDGVAHRSNECLTIGIQP